MEDALGRDGDIGYYRIGTRLGIRSITRCYSVFPGCSLWDTEARRETSGGIGTDRSLGLVASGVPSQVTVIVVLPANPGFRTTLLKS